MKIVNLSQNTVSCENSLKYIPIPFYTRYNIVDIKYSTHNLINDSALNSSNVLFMRKYIIDKNCNDIG